MSFDASFWVAVAFLLFVALFIWKALPAMLKGLDDRAQGIKDQLDEARALREQAEKLLSDYRVKQEQAMTEAKAISNNAKSEAQNMKAKAAADLTTLLARREKSALDKIAQAESNAERDIKIQAVNHAVAATQALMAGNLGAKEDKALIAEAIKEIPSRLQ